jgi:hypothetical protein
MANEITSANVAQAIVKLVAVDALPALMSNLVMGNLVNRSFEPALGNVGDTINVPIPPAMTAKNLAEAGTVTNQNPNLGNAQIVLNTHAEATFVIPDVTSVLASPDLLAMYMKPAVIALAEKIEGDLFGLHALLTANTAVGTANTTITEAVVDNAETTLFDAKVPQSEPKYLVLNGATYSSARQIPRFSEEQTSGDGAAIASGVVASLKGFRVYRSQLVKKVTTTTYNMAFAKDALGLVIRRLPPIMQGTGAVAQYAEQGGFGMRVVMSYDPTTLSQRFTVDVLYGCGVLRNVYGVVVLS